MTVKEKTGRKRYVHFRDPNPDKLRRLVQLTEDSRVVNYHGMAALRIRHSQIEQLRETSKRIGIEIDMVSGTLKALRNKLSYLQ